MSAIRCPTSSRVLPVGNPLPNRQYESTTLSTTDCPTSSQHTSDSAPETKAPDEYYGLIHHIRILDAVPDPDKIHTALKHHPEVQTLAIVHHETTLGLINPVQEIAQVVDDLGRICVVDSVSGLGGESLDVAGSHMYVVAGTAGKCIQGFPGASFVLIRKGFMERVLKYPKRSMYLNLARYYEAQEQGCVPFTPAVQVYAAFDEALNELLEEGVENRIKRYARSAALIRARLGELGVKAVLPADRQSNSLTAFYVPEGLTYQHLHDRLKERGYIIYAGQGYLNDKIFRVANMGSLTQADFEGFVSAYQEIM